MSQYPIDIPQMQMTEFCRDWRITELALFGSVVRDDFHPESDVDVLVTFATDAEWSLFDLVQMQEDLQVMLQCEVHLVEEAGLRNPFRRRAILRDKQVIYAV